MSKRILGFDLGGTKIYSIVVSAGGKIEGTAKKKTKSDMGFDEVVKRVVSCMEDALSEANLGWDDISAIGGGVPSSVDPKTGEIINAVNLGWKKAPLKEKLEKATGKPVFLDNDVNVGVFGEHRLGAARNALDVVGFFVGTGIGGGIVIDGKIHRGHNGMAAELGHLTVVRRGARCGCGNEGCVEALASRTAITRDIKMRIEAGEKSRVRFDEDGALRSGELREAYLDNDPLVKDTLYEACVWLGAAVANMITALCPEIVVIGGGVFEALGKELLPIVEREARRRCFPDSDKGCKIVLAQLADDAVALGAAEFAKENLKPSKKERK